MALASDALGCPATIPFLICRSQAWLCGLPVDRVVETMRPLPLEALPGMPPAVLGTSIIRGAAVPVLDLAALTGAKTRAPPGRYVSLNLGEGRRVALAVEDVLGLRELDTAFLDEVPPLLRDAAAEAVSSISSLDGELLLVLHAARLIPEPMWAQIDMGVAFQ